MSAIRRPLAFRLVNAIGPSLSRLGVGRIDLTPEALEERACRQTGLSDFGNPHYREALARFIDSLHCDGDMHHLGKMAMRDLLTIRLATRLKTTELLKIRPNLAEGGPPKSPVFIIGTMRSGTTLLFNLLVQDPRFRATELWETLDPMPPVSIADPLEVEKRIAKMQKLLGPYNQMLPELRQIHCLENARQKEEDHGILESTFMAGSWAFLMWDGPSYYKWLMDQSVDRQVLAVHEYAQAAQMLMHGHEGKTWLSKAPTEAPLLPALATVFPDARIIHTHRDPRERVPSTASLMRTFHLGRIHRAGGCIALLQSSSDPRWSLRAAVALTTAGKCAKSGPACARLSVPPRGEECSLEHHPPILGVRSEILALSGHSKIGTR